MNTCWRCEGEGFCDSLDRKGALITISCPECQGDPNEGQYDEEENDEC